MGSRYDLSSAVRRCLVLARAVSKQLGLVDEGAFLTQVSRKLHKRLKTGVLLPVPSGPSRPSEDFSPSPTLEALLWLAGPHRRESAVP